MRYVLGIDAGGTKTICIVSNVQGEVKGVGHAGGGNFQSSGVRGAGQEIKKAVDRAVGSAGINNDEIEVACYGVSGADREKDFQTIEGFLKDLNPARRMILVNDTIVALRAGTPDGVGIGLIAGTGTNAIGCNNEGTIKKVGGFGRFFGDYGSSFDLAESAIASAMKGYDGRGKKTILYEKILNFLKIGKLEDIAEFYYVDSFRAFDLARLAPLVFKAANEGDEVAIDILKKAGKSIASSANVLLKGLFHPDELVNIVLGGSLLQKGSSPILIQSLQHNLLQEYNQVKLVRLELEPVLGAVFLALDKVYGKPDPDIIERVKETYHTISEKSN